MTNKQLIISMLIVLVTLGLTGIAFAGDIGSEAGHSEFSFDQKVDSKLLEAAKTHPYDAEVLAVIGTEAGAWDIQHVDADALEAARNYKYDWDKLHAISTEAGDYEAFKLSDKPLRVCILC